MDDKEQEDLKQIEERARGLIKQKKYAQALSLCEEAESRGLRSGRLYASHASALAGLKRWAEAAALIEEGLKRYPSEPGLYSAQAFLLIKQKKHADALAICDYAASIGVWDGKLAANKGIVLVALGRKEEALPFLLRELEKYPEEPSLHFNLGVVYTTLGRKAESKQEYDTAVNADPTLADKVRKSKRWAKLIRLPEIFPKSIYLVFLAILLGFLFWPSLSCYFVPFWLFFVALGILAIGGSLRARRFDVVLAALFLILLFGVLAYFSIFHLPVHIEMNMPFGVRFFFTCMMALGLVIGAVVGRRHASRVSLRKVDLKK